MIPLLTREEARAVDEDAVARLGVQGAVLMENAGRGAAEALLRAFRGSLGAPVLVGGPGQNGGDAWVVGRHLRCAGVTPRALLIGDPARLRGDARTNWEALGALGVRCDAIPLAEAARLHDALAGATVLVDGVFGTGLDRDVEGGYAEALTTMSAHPAPVLALDMPSGIDADTGAVLGVAVRAVRTVTFNAHKLGLHQHPGAGYAGVVELVGIGVPPPGGGRAQVVEPADAAAIVRPREDDAHKGSAGHLFVVGGSEGKTGAAWLAAHAALRAGAGLATIATRAEAQRTLEHKVREVMTTCLPPSGSTDGLLASLRRADALVIGPGLGLDAYGEEVALTETEYRLLETLLRNTGRVLTRQSLLARVWGYDDEPESNAVDLYVHYLRRKLGDAVQITTVRGVGYRLDPPAGGSTPDQPSEGA